MVLVKEYNKKKFWSRIRVHATGHTVFSQSGNHSCQSACGNRNRCHVNWISHSTPDNPGIVGNILAFQECSTRLIKLYSSQLQYISHPSPLPRAPTLGLTGIHFQDWDTRFTSTIWSPSVQFSNWFSSGNRSLQNLSKYVYYYNISK